MPAAPAMPCGTSSLREYALSPTPLTGVTTEVDRIAVSNASFARPFGPSTTVSVPSGDVQTQPDSEKPIAGISRSVGGLVLLPMIVCTSEVDTRLATVSVVDEAWTCDADALLVDTHEPVFWAALAPEAPAFPLEVAAGV